ncbi:nucleoplasmin-2 isoform X2 [Ailuropoda melanoleuca]|uniref:nucleoplasmin-2 isoform X2 n=1 Tax=Ailuropoda melanoleuca TaxID=9646 RepID=UPI0014942726|nr:nucleoplasmin-2 isoform X2 [Ailuropoda melanoleuca]
MQISNALTSRAAAGTRAPARNGMNLSSTSSAAEKAPRAMLWGCELNQEKRTWTVKAQQEGKQDCKLLLSTICLGEKAKEEVNLVEILPPASQEDKKTKPITIASLRASVLPMNPPQQDGAEDTVTLMGLELSPPVTFQLRAGSGPVFLSGQERYNTADLSWEEEEEELEEEGDSDEVDDEDEDEDDVDVSLEEETPVKQVKRLASQKQASIAKKKKVEKEEEAVRPKPHSNLKSQDPRNEGPGVAWLQ